MEHALIGLISILVLGVSAQWMAWRIRMPSIVLLIVFGFLIGPVFKVLNPDYLLKDLLFPLVSISVAIILFEGGLSLKLSELKKVGGVVRNLVSIGVLITWVLATLGARFILNMELPLAVLLGAIFTVTGPTVIVPLLRSIHLNAKTASILKWEAMLNDPIGAILSVLVFESIVTGAFHELTNQAILGMFSTLFVGIILGIAAGWLLAVLLERYWIPDYLQSVTSLMFVVVVFGLSNSFQPESGLVAVTVMGVWLANQKKAAIKHIIEFKENLRVLLIASLFIILAARLDLKYLIHIGASSFLFLGFLILVVRPAAIWASSFRSDLSWKEKAFLAWVQPRGIVAAAVVSVLALHLEQAGYRNADQLVAITFFIIVTTVVICGLTAPGVAKMLQVANVKPQGLLILGAHDWARTLANALKENGFEIMMVDTNWYQVQAARRAGLNAIFGDILSDEVTDTLDLQGVGHFLALTPNEEVNSLAALRFAEIFGRAEVFQLPVSSKESEEGSAYLTRLHGRFLFSPKANFDHIQGMFRQKGHLQKISFTEEYGMRQFQDEYRDKALPICLVTAEGELKMMTAEKPPTPQAGQALIALILPGETAAKQGQ